MALAVEFLFHSVENIVEKGENAGYQHFFLFPQCFSMGFFPRVVLSRWLDGCLKSFYEFDRTFCFQCYFLINLPWDSGHSTYTLKVICQSVNHFYNPSDDRWNFVVDASIQWPGCMLLVLKRLHFLWNFGERLKDCDNDLTMDRLP